MLGWNRLCWDEIQAQLTEIVLLQLLVHGMLRTGAIYHKPLIYTPGRRRGGQRGSFSLAIEGS